MPIPTPIRHLLIGLLLAVASVAAFAANTAQLSWTPPSSYMDGAPIPSGTPITYTIRQGLKGQTKAVAGTVTTSGSTITTGLLSGNEYCWQVTGRVSTGPESDLSNEACKAFPPSPPQPFTLTVQ